MKKGKKVNQYTNHTLERKETERDFNDDEEWNNRGRREGTGR